MTAVSLTINSRAVAAEVEPRTHLADFIREAQTLTGTHLGCEHGVCGACTVLLDGIPVRSCITYTVACSGANVITIEGLDDDEIGKELRVAFAREHALQCGYCTPGMLISARDLVLRAETASEREIRVAMSGNLCRCTGYIGIIRAIQSVIANRRARGIVSVPGAGRAELGPAGSGHAQAMAPAFAAARTGTSVLPQHELGGTLRDWQPQASLEQSFVVKHPVDEVWALFADTGRRRFLRAGRDADRRHKRAQHQRQDAGQGRPDRRRIPRRCRKSTAICKYVFGQDPRAAAATAQQFGDPRRDTLSACAARRARNQGRAHSRLSPHRPACAVQPLGPCRRYRKPNHRGVRPERRSAVKRKDIRRRLRRNSMRADCSSVSRRPDQGFLRRLLWTLSRNNQRARIIRIEEEIR